MKCWVLTSKQDGKVMETLYGGSLQTLLQIAKFNHNINGWTVSLKYCKPY